MLLTHAGVTEREAALLGEREPSGLARALDHALAAAVEQRRPDWTRGTMARTSADREIAELRAQL